MCKHKRRRSRGMTLIEIMVVITLLGIIAAAVGVSAMTTMTHGQIQAAKAQAVDLAKAVETYRVMYGRYPTNSEGLSLLTTSTMPLMERLPKDPWGNDYLYLIPGRMNPHSFDVRSHGPDGVEGGGDDVGNWPVKVAER